MTHLKLIREAMAVLDEVDGVKGRMKAYDLLNQALAVAQTTRPATEIEQVQAFMAKFGHLGAGPPAGPRRLTLRLSVERHEKMTEELDEFRDAARAGDVPAMADALIDLVYFVKGTAAMMGLPWEELWADVHRANMTKERGAVVRQGKTHKVDAVKPPGWCGPKTAHILAVAGFEASDAHEWDHAEYSESKGCEHDGCSEVAEPNLRYCRGHEGGFSTPFVGRTEAES